ncbi:hypothetical protein AAG570_010152 [Ranatra chinensis]|uniref:Uncharacterized protein n=1 Tax=Ranatra chinensis TaxID=642074 RepID=A0ABD0YLR4_9HEMI
MAQLLDPDRYAALNVLDFNINAAHILLWRFVSLAPQSSGVCLGVLVNGLDPHACLPRPHLNAPPRSIRQLTSLQLTYGCDNPLAGVHLGLRNSACPAPFTPPPTSLRALLLRAYYGIYNQSMCLLTRFRQPPPRDTTSAIQVPALLRNIQQINTEELEWINMMCAWLTCTSCLKGKVTRNRVTHLLPFLPPPRFAHVHPDLVGPLPPFERVILALADS